MTLGNPHSENPQCPFVALFSVLHPIVKELDEKLKMTMLLLLHLVINPCEFVSAVAGFNAP